MSKVFNFQDEEENCCPVCDITRDFIDIIADSSDRGELYDNVRNAIDLAFEVGLDFGRDMGFDNGFKEGYKNSLQDDIEVKAQIIDEIEDSYNCEECSSVDEIDFD